MSELKSAFQAAWDRYFKGVSKASKFNDVLANAAITETQFYARERLAKNLLESRAARLSSRFGRNGIIKGNSVGLMTTASIPISIGINKADAILQQRMARVAHSLPPTNFFPPAVIQSKALLPKALRGMFHDAPSSILDTDQIASDSILEEKLKRLDRIRAFGRATQASGFSRYARAEQESNERIDYERELEAEELHRRRMSDKSFEFEMLDKDEQFIQGAMRDKGWSRDQAEQVYFKNLTENTKWLRFIAKDNPKIAKNLIPIAKAVGKASGLPFIGGLFANPTTAIMALGVGAIARTVSGADEANATIKKWKAYEGLYGNPTDKQKRMARLAGIKDVANISKVYGRLNVQRGDAESYLMNIGMAFRAMDERSAQLLAESEGLSPEEVRLAKLYAGEGASKADVVDANIEYLKEIQQRGFETGSGARATMRSLSLSIPYAKSAVARGMVEGDERFNEQLEKIKAKEWSKNRAWSVASNYRYDDPEKYQAMADAIKNAWDEVHDTAEIDDRYRAGMYDNSVTNNGGDRSVTVIQNINAEVKDSDPVGFVKEMTLLGGRGKHEAESVLQNNDSLRTN